MNTLKRSILPIILGFIVGSFFSRPYLVLLGILIILLLCAFFHFISHLNK